MSMCMCILHIVFCTVCKYVLSICKLFLFFALFGARSQEFHSPRHLCCGDVTIKVIWFDLIWCLWPLVAIMRTIKGIVHFEIKIWYLSAYSKGIQDVGVFFSSVDPILMFLGQTVLVCQSYNGRYRSLSLWEGKRTCTEKFKLNNSPS